MNRIEWLMVGVCLTSFGAGLGVGMAVPAAASVLRGRQGDETSERFVEKFREQFELRPDQVRDLRAILLSFYDEKVRIATSADYAEWPARLQAQLVQAEKQMDRRIVWILDDKQRAQYRAMGK